MHVRTRKVGRADTEVGTRSPRARAGPAPYTLNIRGRLQGSGEGPQWNHQCVIPVTTEAQCTKTSGCKWTWDKFN